MATIKLTRVHRLLVGIVLAGAVVIAAIGFVGSYAAVRALAERKGFGDFAPFFPIGIDAGIVVLLALDLLLTWLRIPFPLLRQAAWLLTGATIAFNAAAAWGDPLGVGMHAVIPLLFVITVEAARHAIGRIADITADRHMEGVRLWRWFLSPIPTFRLWRRMKLWELRSYQEVIDLERDRLVYRARLRARYGRAWRRRAPVEERLPLKLAHLGVPLRSDAARAASHPVPAASPVPAAPVAEPAGEAPELPALRPRSLNGTPAGVWHEPEPAPAPEPVPERLPEPAHEPAPAPAYGHQPAPHPDSTGPEPEPAAVIPPPRQEDARRHRPLRAPQPEPVPEPLPEPDPPPAPEPVGVPDDMSTNEAYYQGYVAYVAERGAFPNARQLSRHLDEQHGIRNADGSLLGESYLREYVRDFKQRYNNDMGFVG